MSSERYMFGRSERKVADASQDVNKMSQFRFNGWIFTPNGFIRGRAVVDSNAAHPVTEHYEDETAPIEGILLPGFINAHTHLADFAAYTHLHDSFIDTSIVSMFGPGGRKHELLSKLNTEDKAESIRRGIIIAKNSGTTGLWDFREGGVDGLNALLKGQSGTNMEIISFSRPSTYDEAEKLIDMGAGISISSMRDVVEDFARDMAELTRDRGVPFALHFSEESKEDISQLLELRPDVAVHFSTSNIEDVAEASNAGIFPVFCIRSNHVYTDIPPAVSAISMGIRFGLGTDNAIINAPDMRCELEWSFKTVMRQVRLGKHDLSAHHVANALLNAATYWPLSKHLKMSKSSGEMKTIDIGWVNTILHIREKVKNPLLFCMNYLNQYQPEVIRGLDA